MDAGTGLLWIGITLAAGSALGYATHLVSGALPYRRLARALLVANVGVVTVVFALLIEAFLTLDLSIAYVHAHVRPDYPWYYRLAGAWSGDVGSILLWTWILSLATLLFAIGGRNETPLRARVRTTSSAFLSVLLAAFLYVVVVADPFRPTPATLLVTEGTAEGLGLSPVLLTPLVIVHPPLEFLAYALLAIPFVASLSYLLLGRGDWSVVAMQWTRAAWLFLTLAMIVGALWAYTVLGWGGYWAWDPVETTNLLVWIPLTGLVHAQLWQRRKRQFPHLSVLLAGLAFAFAMFATFETRTGIILSVHSFSPSSTVTSPDLGTRLVSAITAGGAIPYFFVMMAVALLSSAAGLLLFFLRLRRREGVPPWRLLPAVVFLALFVGAIGWTILNPRGVVQATLDVMRWLSLGRGALGVFLLVGIVVGLPLLWVLWTSPRKDEPGDRTKEWISDDGAVALALGLFVLWAVVTTGLMIGGANSLSPAMFEQRLPFLLLPLGAVMFVVLAWRRLGRHRVPYALVGLGFAIVVSFVAFSSNLGGLYFPLALALILASAYQIGRVWAPALLPRRLRLAAVCALTSLLLAFLMWSSGTQRFGLPGLGVESSLAWSVLGTAASLAGIVLLAWGIVRHDWRGWVGAGVLGVALLGFLIGPVLSIASLIFLLREKQSFGPETPRRALSLTSILRAGSPPLIHLGVALLLLGYAASSYFATEAQVTAATDAVTASFSGYAFRLVRSSGQDFDGDGRYEVITAEVSVARGGVPQFVAALQLVWRDRGVATPRYLPEPYVHSEMGGDLAFTFVGFSDGIWSYSINDRDAVKAVSDTLTSALIRVRENPLMVPLWGGGWTMAVGMGFRMWSDRNLIVRERPDAAGVGRKRASARDPPSRGDEYYHRMLDNEIEREE